MLRNKNDILKLEKELNRLKKDLNQYSDEMFNQLISEKWEILKEDKYLEDLKSLPVDIISTLERNIPINTLMNQGLHTIYDVRDKKVFELIRLEGIGKITAEAIVNAVTKIKTSIYKQAVPRINPDNLSEDAFGLLEEIYKKWELAAPVQFLRNEIDSFDEATHEFIKRAKMQRNFFGALFQRKVTKEKIAEAFDELNKSKYKEALSEMNKQYKEIIEFTISHDELKEHFIKENAAYFTEIEKITEFKQAEMSKDLPTEIIETVNSYPLNTTNLKVDLRSYQEFGAKYGLHFKRTLLGDEMGLGKTIQALAMINHLFENNQKFSIVVCPLSILANWKKEISKHSYLKTFIFHGNNRDMEFKRWKEEKGVLLTTYEHTLRMDLKELNQLDLLIVDEAHYVKNPEAKRSKSVYQLAELSEYVMFMSGTPLENRLEEMKQLISVLQVEIANRITNELHLLQPIKFKKTIAEVYLRRNRQDVLAELPDLEVIPQWVDFGEDERRTYYEAVNAGQMMLMRRAAWLGGSPDKSPKLAKLLDICDEARDNGHKVLVFSFFRGVIDVIQKHLKERTFEAITGDVPNERRQDIIDEFTESSPGSVLVSQIDAGGVGLNIQAANIVILCEPQWKPSTEEQAISRAYRMGQSRNVLVYRLLTEDSIDVSMLEILGEKSNLFDTYARDSEVATLAMKEEAEAENSLEKKVLKIEQERLKKQEEVVS